MTKRKYIYGRMMSLLIVLLHTLMLASCTGLGLDDTTSSLVIEGWIEDGRYPVVLLTTSVPVSAAEQTLESLDEYVVRWGKVTISDGEREVVLTGGPDKRFLPPYYYTTARMRGEAGKTYTIKASYDGAVATAVTTIPRKKELEYLRVESVTDSSYVIMAGIEDDPMSKDFYKFFVLREGKDSTYQSSFLGLISDGVLDDDIVEVPVYNSMTVRDSVFQQYFAPDDVVYVRFSTMDQTSWFYWSDFEEIQSLSRNPFFPVSTPIRSNIEGGLGIWSGYGSCYYKVSIPDSLAGIKGKRPITD